MAAHRMTPARKAALRKAQIASARKRKGRGKAKKVNSGRRKAIRRTAIAAGAIGTAGYVFKNREKLIVRHVAVTKAVHQEIRSARSMGQKLSKHDIQWIKHTERTRHANRSSFRVREYKAARQIARLSTSRGRSLNPARANSAWGAGVQATGTPVAHRRAMFEAYRKDVYSRAVARHARMTGKKRKFNSGSGKRLLVNQKGKVRRAFWA